MSAELSFRHTGTGKTMKATIRKQLTVGGKVQMWQTAGTPGWEDLTVANWANYILTMTETPASSYVYVGSWPATLTAAGWYVVDFYDGATIAGTLAGTFLGYWDGATFGLGGADVRQNAGVNNSIADTTGNWATAGTWEDGAIPAAGNNIIIRNGVTVTVAADLDLGQFGTMVLQGYSLLNIDTNVTVAIVPAGWEVTNNQGTVTDNYGRIDSNCGAGVVTYNSGTIELNLGIVTYNTGIVEINTTTITNNYGTVEVNSATGTIADNKVNGIVSANYGAVTINAGFVNPVQIAAAAALAAVIGAKGGIPKLDSSTGLIVQGYGSGGVTVGTVTTVTNQLTAAQIATGVWQDATAGDFAAASSIGKSLFTSGVVPGGAGGIAIVGSAMTNATLTKLDTALKVKS